MTASPRPKTSRGKHCVEIEATLQFHGPLHVGTGQRLSPLTDAPVLRDHEGAAYLPGSSVRGVLRDHAEREARLLGVGDAAVDRLFGRAGPGKTGDRQGCLRVEDVKLPNVPGVEVRDHVKLDRRYGAAERGLKFDQELVHPDRASLRMVYEGEGPGDEELRLVDELVRCLRHDRLLALGGKSAWGQGIVSATRVTRRVTDRSVPDQLSSWLGARTPAPPPGGAQQVAEHASQQPKRHDLPPIGDARPAEDYPEYAPANRENAGGSRRPPWSWLRLAVRIQLDGPFLVAAADPGESDADAAPFRDGRGRIVLPGSSLRGALHSEIDRICTTLGTPEIAHRLFGIAKGEQSERRGLLRVGEGVLCADPVQLRMEHVAIDRLTQFAADKKLFNADALASPCFESELMVRWHHADKGDRAAVAALLFGLRDLAQGWIWLGSRTTRGYGRVHEVTFSKAVASTVNGGSRTRKVGTAAGSLPLVVGEVHELGQFMQAWREATGVPTPGTEEVAR